MSSVRLKKVEALILKDLGEILRVEARTFCSGAMVTVTVVNVAADLSYAKVYLSIFGHEDQEKVFKSLNNQKGEVRYALGKKAGKSLRRIPDLDFRIDDSLDYAEEIDGLLKE